MVVAAIVAAIVSGAVSLFVFAAGVAVGQAIERGRKPRWRVKGERVGRRQRKADKHERVRPDRKTEPTVTTERPRVHQRDSIAINWPAMRVDSVRKAAERRSAIRP